MSAPVATEPSPRTRAFVAWTIRFRRVLVAAVLLLAIPATYRTAMLYLHLKTEIEELLPREAESVIAIEELRARIPGLLFLGVVVDTGDAKNLPAGEKLVDDLAARIRNYPPELARKVRTGVQEEHDFLEKNAALYADVEDLQTIRKRIEARRDYEVAKETGALLDESEPPPPVDFSDIEKKYKDKSPSGDRFPNSRFTNEKMHLTMLLVEVGEFGTGQGSSGQLLSRVQADIRALDPSRYAPGIRIGYTGDVAISVEETSALVEDLSISSALVIAAVVGVIVFYYRWWRSVLILIPPLLLATVFTFALASLPPFGVTALNSNTAFLGSIIVGNGINFGIVLLARYVEERRAGKPVEQAMAAGLWGARSGTLAAALAAGVAYASLGITEFRGFRQFGYIGGIGMTLSWLLAYTLMPPLASWVDRGDKAAPDPKKQPGTMMAPLARFVSRFPGPIAVVALLLTLAAGWKVKSFGPDAIEYDLSKLRRADTWVNGEGYWGQKMDALLGATLTPMAILADDQAEAEAIAVKLKESAKKPPLDELIDSVRIIDDVVPSNQAAKVTEIEAIRKDLTPRLRQLIPPDKREAVDKLLGGKDLKPVTADALPATFTAGMRERDGSIGRTVLVYPKPTRALWMGQPIVTLANALRGVATSAIPGKKPARVAGYLELTADIFSSLRRDGPLATGLAFLGVAAVVVILFRRSMTSVFVLTSLTVGVLWLLAAAMGLGVKINFTNFIAYPITFGIGVDYSVNVMSRYVQDGSRDVMGAIRSTGGAVTLCSATTIIGYSSLLLAQNRALYLFGLLAVLGEITCLTAAIVALPSVLLWLRNRKGGAGSDVTAK